MALESGQVFAVMQVAYRQGVLDRFNPLLGEALDGAMEETGFNIYRELFYFPLLLGLILLLIELILSNTYLRRMP